MFNQVVPRIHNETGGQLLTKHDSIMIAGKHANQTDQIFREEFEKIGLCARLKVETHNTPSEAPVAA